MPCPADHVDLRRRGIYACDHCQMCVGRGPARCAHGNMFPEYCSVCVSSGRVKSGGTVPMKGGLTKKEINLVLAEQRREEAGAKSKPKPAIVADDDDYDGGDDSGDVDDESDETEIDETEIADSDEPEAEYADEAI